MTTIDKEIEMKAYRFEKKKVAVDDTLENSHVWDGDQVTDDELPGVCAFETRMQAEKYAQYSHNIGKIVEIEGERAGSGLDMVGEVIIRDAVVTAIYEW
jgi:hypothetical protein